jgi:hypothetical protein
MMMLWAWAGVPLGVYNIAEEFNIALRIQPQILTLLSLVTWIQCFYYEKVWFFPKLVSISGTEVFRIGPSSALSPWSYLLHV